MRSFTVTLLLAGGLLSIPSARAEPEISVEVFVEALAPYGDWVIVAEHGRVFRPHHLPAGWRPYTIGYWSYTEHGWTWVSDWEPAWAVYHYGRWYLDPIHGWVWVPDTIWGPAWVAWSWSDDWIGWAPLPPGVHWTARIGFDLGAAELGLLIGAPAWIFVEPRYFASRRVSSYVVPVHRNRELLPRTRIHLTHRHVEGRIVNRGIPIKRVERAIGRPVERRPIYRPEDRERDDRLRKGKKPKRR